MVCSRVWQFRNGVFPIKFWKDVPHKDPTGIPQGSQGSHKDPARILQEPRKDPTRIYKDLWDFVGSSGFLVGLLAEFLGNPWIPCGIPCGIWLFIRTQICNIFGSLRVVDRRGSQMQTPPSAQLRPSRKDTPQQHPLRMPRQIEAKPCCVIATRTHAPKTDMIQD